MEDRRGASLYQSLGLAAGRFARFGDKNRIGPQAPRNTLNFVALLHKAEFELGRLELRDKLRLMQHQPRVLRTHLELQKCGFGNEGHGDPAYHEMRGAQLL